MSVSTASFHNLINTLQQSSSLLQDYSTLLSSTADELTTTADGLILQTQLLQYRSDSLSAHADNVLCGKWSVGDIRSKEVQDIEDGRISKQVGIAKTMIEICAMLRAVLRELIGHLENLDIEREEEEDGDAVSSISLASLNHRLSDSHTLMKSDSYPDPRPDMPHNATERERSALKRSLILEAAERCARSVKWAMLRDSSASVLKVGGEGDDDEMNADLGGE